MILKEKEVQLKEIKLDNFNPRFNKDFLVNQECLISELQKGDKSRELLTSMLTEIRWVNKIVLVEITQLSENEKEKYRKINPDFENQYKYIVVEGNTRVANLYHPQLRVRFDEDELIPVIVAFREDSDTDKSFLQERKRLQNIANVMVVKEWPDISKARQLHTSFKLVQEINPDKTEREIIKELADSLGMKTIVVKNFIYRYAFYKELIDNGYSMEERDFKFLEGLHQNSSMINNFGLNNKAMEFEWNIKAEDDKEGTEVKQQLLNMFPQLVEIAKDEKISSKKLRDILRLRAQQNDNEEALLQKFLDLTEYYLTDDYANDGFSKIFELEEGNDEEIRVENNIKSAMKSLKNFPVNSDFAIKLKEDINKIQRLAERIISFMELYKDEENRTS